MKKIIISMSILTLCSLNQVDAGFISRCIHSMIESYPYLFSDLNVKNWQEIAQACESLEPAYLEIDENFPRFRSRKEEPELVGGFPKEFLELKEHILHPQRFMKFGAECIKGVLLVGPTGTGKTMLVREFAKAVDALFLYASASSFIEMYVGVGAQRIRDLFNQAKELSARNPGKKVFIFIDEFDALGKVRQSVNCSEYQQTINELLTQMDGFNQNSSIIVFAATNLPQVIDPAFKRGGRFDYIIEVGLPDYAKRVQLLEHHLQKNVLPRYLDQAIDYEYFAQQTPNFSAADIKTLAQIAKNYASNIDAERLSQEHVEFALQEMKKKKKW